MMTLWKPLLKNETSIRHIGVSSNIPLSPHLVESKENISVPRQTRQRRIAQFFFCLLFFIVLKISCLNFGNIWHEEKKVKLLDLPFFFRNGFFHKSSFQWPSSLKYANIKKVIDFGSNFVELCQPPTQDERKLLIKIWSLEKSQILWIGLIGLFSSMNKIPLLTTQSRKTHLIS